MTNLVIVGGQWGDEGKAKVIDLLSGKADVIIRFQGGCNAGHTVVTNDQTYKFHLIPSGILYPGKICLIGNGTVINPEVLWGEIQDLKDKGIDVSNLFISPQAHVTLPYHIAEDALNEESLKDNKIGTTKRGIGPTYMDKIARTGIRLEDLFEEEALSAKLDVVLAQKNALFNIHGKETFEKAEILEFCKTYAEKLKGHVKDFTDIVLNALDTEQNILFEGAQGAMLDIDHGTYPFVTSSNPIAGNASVGSGVGYVTRVGEGPFMSELTNEEGEKLQKIGKEFGTTTGRKRRCGWFDAVVSRYSARINGLTGLALTKVDIFDEFDEIKICTAYKDRRNGDLYENYPLNTYIHNYLEPVYEALPGWKQDISEIRNFEDLPENARNFVLRVEALTGVPVEIVSVGANREQTIIRNFPI